LRVPAKAFSVEAFFKHRHVIDLGLRLVAGERGLKRLIREPTVNRPGMLLCGFKKHFAGQRIQIIGNAEHAYLQDLSPKEHERRLKLLFSHRIPCVVFSRNRRPSKDFLRLADAADVPVFETPLITMKFISRATLVLDLMFAPTGIVLGSMVDIQGVGVIIRGESGIGKSESVLALLERGYCLVADDVTCVKLVDGREVVGSSKEITRNHMEVRGIGIIDVAALFGVKAIRPEKRVDLLITLKRWEEVPDVDRVGAEQEFEELLTLKIPQLTLPVRPGRDMARLIEVAAFHQKLKDAGHNPAQALNEKLLAQMQERAGLARALA
jgi:HPr kinase/phosphorylase